jgi:hypothetical protein
MADPIGVAGTALGVVSLGLELCKGLVSYIKDVRDRDEDISSALRQVDNLRTSLEVIEASMDDLDDDHLKASAAAEKTLQACALELQTLEDYVTKLKPAQSPQRPFKGKARDVVNKLTYPFHKSTLVDLQERLNKINSLLGTALDALGL